MNQTSRTQAHDDVGHHLTERVDHLMRTHGCHWPTSLAAIDQQGRMVWLTMKTDEVGVIVHDACVTGVRDLLHCPPIHSAARGQWNLRRCAVRLYGCDTCSRKSLYRTRDRGPTMPRPTQQNPGERPLPRPVSLLTHEGLRRVRPRFVWYAYGLCRVRSSINRR
jgi:hypothetical protein